jgi:hypothetical protein
MEDASGIDLDWFWRGWFFGTDHVDLSLDQVKWMQSSTGDPSIEKPIAQAANAQTEAHIGVSRNKVAIPKSVVESDSSMNDFYNRFDPFEVTKGEQSAYRAFMNGLDDESKKLLENKLNFYELTFGNPGGLPMPVILQFTFSDGSKQVERIPAEFWRYGDDQLSKVFMFPKEVSSIELDPFLETADVDFDNNHWPAKLQPSRFQLYKDREVQEDNTMRRMQREAAGGN